MAVLVLALTAAGCASAAGPGWTFAPASAASSSPGAASASPVAPKASQPAAAAGEIAIDAFDLGFRPASIEVPAAGTYVVKFDNTGAIFHDVTFADGTRIEAQAGQMAEGQVTIPAEGTTFICSVPGHEQGGMTGEAKVAGSTADSGDDHGGTLPADDVKADPNATRPVRHDPTAPSN